MAARGPYTKGVAKRAEILDAALEVIDSQGYSGATVKQLAEAVGLSQNGLLHYFGSREALFLEIVRHQGDVVAVRIDLDHADFSRDLAGRILRAAHDAVDKPGMSRLMLNLATSASEEGHLAHTYMAVRYVKFRDIITTILTQLQGRGLFAADGRPEAVAALVVAALDGLQLQWLFDNSVDVEGSLAYLLVALGVRDSEPAVSEAEDPSIGAAPPPPRPR